MKKLFWWDGQDNVRLIDCPGLQDSAGRDGMFLD